MVPPESDDNLRLEIGHVLFIDIVDYSKLLNEEQKERLNQLTEIVLATTPVREVTDEQLVRLPTGDGMALVFRHSAEEPARCALEIAEALQKHPELPVRMGIHSGPVSEVTDVSGRTNIAGAGINMAQRVMDCGDAGHILLSQHVADDLVHSRQWASRLRDLGECEVKHGVRLHLVNLYAEPLGNAAVPQKFQQAKPKPAAEKPARRSVGLIAALVFAALLAAGATYYFTSHRAGADVVAIQSESDKAIADQLQAKLSPNEKKAIEQPPTTDLAAFDLYSRAKSLLLTAGFSATSEPDLRKAIELLDEAVKRDPSFFDAYCQLAYAHEFIYAVRGSDHTPARLALAEAAVQAATRLRPDAAETHLARAYYLYQGLRDYAGALAELESARRALHNDPRLFELTGFILQRRGQQKEGLQNLQRAVELDPRNFFTLQQIALSYQSLGRHAEAIAALDRALTIMPDNVETRATRGLFYFCWK